MPDASQVGNVRPNIADRTPGCNQIVQRPCDLSVIQRQNWLNVQPP